jgi:enamine deaminase RidA (YjgF/YER057c/UK114 family)
MHQVLQPPGWKKPAGYANGIAARGRLVFVGGQVGWNADCVFETDDLIRQIEQTLRNVVAVLAEAGAAPRHVTTMTWYFTDKAAYLANLKPIGKVYRETFGTHYPAMAAVQIQALIEDRAKVEIQAIAVVPD